MSAILQTLIGAAAAIVGGFVGAWWQTRRADDIAWRIRREERGEQALIALAGKAGDLQDRVLRTQRAAIEGTSIVSDEHEARQLIGEIRQLWLTDTSVTINVPAVNGAFQEFTVKADELLPRRLHAPSGSQEVERYISDLDELLGLVIAVRANALRALEVSRRDR
jgi:hypothetical protein